MKSLRFLILAGMLILLSACQSQTAASVTILADGTTHRLSTADRVPRSLLALAKLELGKNDRILYLGASTPPDGALPEAKNVFLELRRAVTLTLVSPDGTKDIQTSAVTVGQALAEGGIQLYAADRVDPPVDTPISGPLTVNYTPSRLLNVSLDGGALAIRSAAATVGQALAGAGIPLEGLDISQPDESAALPADGNIHLVRVTETLALTQKSIPFKTTTILSPDLEIDQQELQQGGQPGLSIARTRIRSQDGVEVSRQTEGDSVVRPPQDRVLAYGEKIVPHTAVVDGQTITYWRALRLYATNYSPCRSAGIPGKCYYGTSSGLPVKKGVVAMIYYWYLLFGGQNLYIPGYGYAVVGDVGASPSNHYWIDLGWSEEEWPGNPPVGWMTVYFLYPAQDNPGYILP